MRSGGAAAGPYQTPRWGPTLAPRGLRAAEDLSCGRLAGVRRRVRSPCVASRNWQPPAPMGTLAALLGPPGSSLRRWRLLLAGALALGLAYLLGPYQPWRLPHHPTLIPHPGQSRIHIVLVAMWWAAAANVVLAAALLATSGLWAREEREPLAARARPPARPTALAVALFLAACALGGALRWPLAHKGVWWDEAWTVRNVIVGSWQPVKGEPGRLEFDPASWMDTLWYYKKPTNHALYSVAARASIDLWRAATGKPRSSWDEFALRLPAFASGLLAIFLIGWLVHDLGFPRAAPAAAFLLAIHPWHIRFSADGRGYAPMVLCSIAAALCLLHGLRDGRWRWWLGYGASQLGLLWIHPLAIHYPVALGLAGALGIWLGPGSREDRSVRLGRFLAANALAAMAFLQVMLPNLTQGLALGREWQQPPDQAAHLGQNTWIYLATGLHRSLPWDPDYRFPSLKVIHGGGFWVKAFVYGLLPALTALGFLRAVRRPGSAERAVVLGLAAAVPLVLLHRALHGFLLIERFAIYGLAAVVPFLAIGTEGLLAALLPRAARRVGVPLGLALALLGFQAFVAPQTRVLLERPQMPSREIVDFLTKAGEGIPGGVIRAGVALGGNVPDVYDPFILHVDSRREIADLCRRSRQEGRPLYVFYGYNDPNRKGPFKAVFRDLDDTRSFEEVAHFGAIESDFVFRVFRYTGRPPDEG
jgi:hypothetical protein